MERVVMIRHNKEVREFKFLFYIKFLKLKIRKLG